MTALQDRAIDSPTLDLQLVATHASWPICPFALENSQSL
jgi:hypothetical protein